MRLRRRTKRLREQLLQLLPQGYSVARACAAVGISRRTFYRWLKSDPAFEEAVEVAETRLIAAAEKTLLEAIEQGDTRAAMWVLERRAPEYRPPHMQPQPIGIGDDLIVEFVEVPAPQIDPEEWLREALSGDEQEQEEWLRRVYGDRQKKSE